jgi:lysophospholipase L1-like esterase
MSHTVALLGDSLTSAGRFPETASLPGVELHNLGIPGDTTWGILARLHKVWDLKPDMVFLMIGANDLGQGERVGDIVVRHREIWDSVRTSAEGVLLTVHPLLPINPGKLPAWGGGLKNGSIFELNYHIEVEAAKLRIPILDFREPLMTPEGALKGEYTQDGLHLVDAAYVHWDKALCECVRAKTA